VEQLLSLRLGSGPADLLLARFSFVLCGRLGRSLRSAVRERSFGLWSTGATDVRWARPVVVPHDQYNRVRDQHRHDAQPDAQNHCRSSAAHLAHLLMSGANAIQ
jgi:hypothetical protein